MSKRFEKLSEITKTKALVAGQIMEQNEDMVTIKTGGCIFDIPAKSIVGRENVPDGMVILTLAPDAKIMVTDIMSAEELIGAYSSKISRVYVRPDTECCECVPTFCVDNTQCQCQCECSECNILARFKSMKFRRH